MFVFAEKLTKVQRAEVVCISRYSCSVWLWFQLCDPQIHVIGLTIIIASGHTIISVPGNTPFSLTNEVSEIK